MSLPCLKAMTDHCTYQIEFRLSRKLWIEVGSLGRFLFPAGRYVYTGSARRNLRARVARHLRRDKTLRWHIDYLLSQPWAHVLDTRSSGENECELNQSVRGEIIVRGFGASDCRRGCGSHLKYLG